ncbi:MAG: ATP-binding cassette domain-containing protein [Vibrionaceae bacterium]
MINAFFNLISELNILCSDTLKAKLQLSDNSEEVLIKHIEKELENPLFSYKFISGEINEGTKINSPFVVVYENKYFFVKYVAGAYYDEKGSTSLNRFVGCRYFELREIAKIKKPHEVVEQIVSFTPVWSMLFLLLTPFALLTPLYTNIFNTRLINANSIFTLLIVSSFFFVVYAMEFFAKKAIKKRCLKANAESAVQFERYLLKFTPTFKGFSSIHSVKTVEQYRKMVWDFIPNIASDLLTFVFMFITLSVFVSWLSIYFLIFYAAVFGIFFLYRSKLYAYLIEQESASSDVLKSRISNVALRNAIPYVNKYLLYAKYLSTYKSSQYSEDKIGDFNFYWDELTKIVSFLALFLLFTISFIGVSNSILNPAYMIVLFIISSRLSGLMGQIATRGSYLKASLLHLNKSMESLFSEDFKLQDVDTVGVKLEDVKKIKVSGLTIKMDQQVILHDVNMKFHKGILYGIKGKVGSGKSTLLKMLIGISKEYSGKIEYDGLDINVIDQSFFQSRVSYLSVESDFFTGSLYDNFVFRNCNSNKIIESVLKECFGNRVFDYQSLYVNDIESIPMSTGQKRKLLFMLALLSKVKLYVFDEVIVNLSKEDIVKSINLLRKYSEDAIVIMSSHNESVLGACDVIYEIEHNTVHQTKG